jgi:hypothetical protein
MPRTPPNFDEVMTDLTKFQLEIGKIHASLTNPRHKEVLGQALASVEKARQETLVAYPKAVATIRASAQKSQASAKASLAKIAELQQKFAVQASAAPVAGIAAAGAGAALSAKAALKPATPKFDGQLGARLSSELVARIADAKPQADASLLDDKEIWQDWGESH